MKREVVQDFLNLPGIAGVALMDGRSRPYFFGVDQSLNFQQKEALAQGIQQVVETTPADFEFFEFQFTGHQVYIYKLNHGIILLVLTGSSLVYPAYLQAVEQLKIELQEDIANTIATFRLLAGNITLSNQNYWKQRPEVNAAAEGQSPSGSTKLESQFKTHTKNGTPTPSLNSANKHLDSPPTQAQSTASAPLTSPITDQINLKELLLALNHLSQFTTQYLGTTVVNNYWKSSRPAVEWLNNFQIDRSAQITFSASIASSDFITINQHQYIQQWVSAFIERCAKVIRDFPLIIRQAALDDEQKRLLLADKA
ncbi:hypothetical protein H6F88_10930 [Oculatella sp. FACHB-28]|uniref:hypothetical protein n=1 Tax=Cyanophyceae TaxID=3028117 RepID=UPI0016891129|nr:MULTISPECIES: hypothetical protein [Cyanophyceae]MBD1870800.1 hypothetical protein [Cyanobacteria bacterium FACHB-471]MBD2056522.1 hypothetical protein [Oculatella sp. FACHB-28]MBD2069094.1 hypothetical protein [Leptolyngbya sp. FACHB-671]